MVEAEQSIKKGVTTFLTFGAKSVQAGILERLLIGRKETADNLYKYANQIANNGLNHQVILIGPRGSGKTHLLRVLFHRSQPLIENGQLVIAYFAEEEYGIDGYLDFLIRIINAFIRWYEVDASFLEEKLNVLRDTPSVRQEDLAENIIISYIDKRPLLILAENLDEIFDALDKAGQHKLRAFLYRHNRTSIIATSQAISGDLKEEDKPFYNFFTVTYLQKLTFEDSLALLQELAAIEAKPELIEHLQNKGKGQVKAIYELVKGNHRLLVTFFEFLKADSLAELSTLFMKTINDLKPYFESYIRHLPPQQQKIVHYLALAKTPKRGTDICRDCFIAGKSISKQLSELQRRRLVEGFEDPESKRDKLYDIAEPLLRIAIEIGEQKYGITSLFIDFLALYYSGQELTLQKERFELLYQNENRESIRQKYNYEIVAREKALELKAQFDKEQSEVTQKKIDKLIHDGKYRELIEFAGEIHPNKNEMYYILIGYSQYQLKEIENAIHSFQQAITFEPGFELAWFNLGNCYASLTELDKAINCYLKAIDFMPEYVDAWYNLGVTYNKLNQYEKAIECFDKAVTIYPDREDTWFSLGITYVHIKKFAKAIDCFQKVTSINPHNIDGWFNMGVNYTKIKQNEKSIECFQKVLSVNPDDEDSWYNLGNRYAELTQYEKAIECYQKAININPNFESSRFNLGNSLAAIDQFENAAECYKKAIDINPSSVDALVNLGNCYSMLDLEEKAIECYEMVLQLKPNNDKALFNMGISLIELNDKDKAQSIFIELLKYETTRSYKGLIILLEMDIQSFQELYTQNEALMNTNSSFESINSVIISYLKDHKNISTTKLEYFESIIKDVFYSPNQLMTLYHFLTIYRRYKFGKEKKALYELPKEQRDFFKKEILGMQKP